MNDKGSKMRMKLFLFTELILFGGMFVLYAAYRYKYPDNFKVAALSLDTLIGTVNTILLLTSSLTIGLAGNALLRKNKTFSIYMLSFTVITGGAFLVNKYIEWSIKIYQGIYPGGPEMANLSDGEVMFYGLYYFMTGFHALHVIVGLIFILFMIVFVIKDKQTFDNNYKLENTGLYWHLVVIIWIFLFPLFYLIH
ncbi:MAG: cytochrome c oxidase subunit 3 [Ignavibacteriae bacterium]|jgi:cytochrome c oxidase subunit 3|nr:cytochrome c oxidase subunit 3 [Ignavibacteriota bacterium]